MTDIVLKSSIARSDKLDFFKWWNGIDHYSLSVVTLLLMVGLVLNFAASVPLAENNNLDRFYYVKRQIIFSIISLTLMVLISMFSLKFVRRLSIVGCAVSLLALIFLPWFGTDFGKGSVRWYSLGFIGVQPSEFVKPFFIIFSSWLLVSGKIDLRLLFVMVIVVVFLLVIQPDFGQASLILASWLMIYFAVGAALWLLFLIVVITITVGIVIYLTSEHFAYRIDAFINPVRDSYTQLSYASKAIREGGFFGVGVGEGKIKWLLPDAHTDFIIAVAAEEFGLLSVLLIIGLYLFLTVRCMLRLMNILDDFSRIAGIGLISLFTLQVFINMGVAARLLPAKGLTLPFISYGGSSLVAWGISFGMLFMLSRLRGGEVGLLSGRLE